MQNELKKLNAAKRDHAKLQRNQQQYEKQRQMMQTDLKAMKMLKVRTRSFHSSYTLLSSENNTRSNQSGSPKFALVGLFTNRVMQLCQQIINLVVNQCF